MKALGWEADCYLTIEYKIFQKDRMSRLDLIELLGGILPAEMEKVPQVITSLIIPMDIWALQAHRFGLTMKMKSLLSF